MTIRAGEVLSYLIPSGEWVIYGEEFEGIQFLGDKKITKQEFVDGFDKLAAKKADEMRLLIEQRKTILDRLGLTEDEAKLLLS